MRELDKVLGTNEHVMWEGKPVFWPFFLGSSIVTTIFGMIWLLFMIPFLVVAIMSILQGNFWGFGILLLPHFWIGVIFAFGMPLYQYLVYKHIYYAITDKRVIFQKGLIGRDFEMVDFDQITNAEVNVNLFDKLFAKNSGSIFISTAGSFTYTRRGQVLKPYTLRNIQDPYTVFRLFKKVSHAVKTDIQYPNKLRPKTNPGYKTNLGLKSKKGVCPESCFLCRRDSTAKVNARIRSLILRRHPCINRGASEQTSRQCYPSERLSGHTRKKGKA